jgi:NodT family efflux transporter outer membrane factor (OMF) lipoprotein
MIARPLLRPASRRGIPSRFLLLPPLLAALLALGGCVSSSDKAQGVAIEPARLGLDESAADARTDWPAAQWWKAFGDPQLDALIDRALADSPSMDIAGARVRLAQQAAIAARAIDEPSVALNAQVNRQRYSENYIYPAPLGGTFVTDSRVALDFSYEFDFWGGQRAAIEGARQQLAAEQAQRAAAELILSISVAQSYFSLQHSARDAEFAATLVQQRTQTLKLQRLRAERGLISQGDTQVPKAQLADAERALAVARQRIDLYRHQLAALTAQGPEALADLSLADTNSDPTLVPPQHLPADLLARRADIHAQRLLIETASQDVAVARADFYPNIDLTAFAGVQSLGTRDLFKSNSKTYGVGPALHLPIFNRNTLRAQYGARLADYDLAIARYNDSVLGAAREAADASSNLRALDQQRSAADTSLQALQRARDLAKLRHQQGLGNYLDVLAADISLLSQQRVVAALRDDQRQATLALIRALGGGYVTPTDATATGTAAAQ